jgi:hypothetical protein
MRRAEEIFEQAKALPDDERRRLIDRLQESLRAKPPAHDEGRAEALKRWLAMAGMGHTDHADVSTDKYKHLADIYADKT